MNHYICWVVDRRAETEEEIEAESSFKARQEKAAQWGVGVTDCVSVRVFRNDDDPDAPLHETGGQVMERDNG